MTVYFFADGHAPTCLTNSKGRKRMPGSIDLNEIVKTSDEHFLDFIIQCLQ